MEKVTQRTRDSYNKIARIYTENTKAFNETIMHRYIIQLAKKYRFEFNGKIVLDAGCGPGGLMLGMQSLGANTYGLDISEKLLDIAVSRGLGNLVCGSLHEAESWFAPNMFDGIFSNFALHYLPPEGQAMAMKSFYEIAKPDCLLIFSLCHPYFMRSGYFNEESQSFPSKTTNYFEPHRTDNWGQMELGETLDIFRLDWPEIHATVRGAGFDVLEMVDGVMPQEAEMAFRDGPNPDSMKYLIELFKKNPFAVFVVARK